MALSYRSGWAAVSCTILFGHGLSATEHLNRAPHQPPAPLVLVFDTPTNGSTVQGTNIDLMYTLRTARSGSVLTHEEVKLLHEDGVSLCFAAERPSPRPAVCVPLQISTIHIKAPLPGTWHTVTATLHGMVTKATAGTDSQHMGGLGRIPATRQDTEPIWKDAGDSISFFVGMEGISSMCGESACLDSSDLRSEYFDNIYRNGHWGDTRSGGGSAVSASSGIRLALEEVLQSYTVESLLDAPCGDLTWMPHVRGINQVGYTGVDISYNVIEDNRRKFYASPMSVGQVSGDGEEGIETLMAAASGSMRGVGGIREPVFVQEDLVEGVPPAPDGRPYDLVFVRDLMLHLPPRHNLRIIRNIEASGARLLMASTYLGGRDNWCSNTFIPVKFHDINLSLPPYCLRPPVALFPDVSYGRNDQRMGLWVLDATKPLITPSSECGEGVDWGGLLQTPPQTPLVH